MTTHRRFSSGVQSIGSLFFGAALAMVIGCSSAPGGFECVSGADCASGYTCIDGTCTQPFSTTDGLGDRVDAGSSSGDDAGRSTYDAGSLPPDAGYGGYDAGAPDASNGVDAGGVCGQAACNAHGAECGQVIDACGAIVDCPSTCGNGYRCGDGAFANRCQCQPLSCQQLGAQCGRITDNCGVSRDCNAETGGCGSQERCNAGNNRCECVPLECNDVGAQCGPIDTGCGWTRDCGGCTPPERCGGPGVQANRCGCTTRQLSTDFEYFLTARNANASTGSTNWDDLGNAAQNNSSGADFDVTGYCGYEGGGGGSGCSCCARAEARDTTTNYLQLTNGSLGIPSGATIRGIQVQFRFKKTGGTARIENLALVGPQTSVNRARSVSFDDDYRIEPFGSPTDLWGRSWTASQLNSANFGVRLQMYASAACNRNSSSCQRTGFGVDFARVRVHYEVCE